MRLKAIVIGLLLALGASSSASAQCSGQPAAGRICANVGGTPALPGWATATSVLDSNFGGSAAEGTVLNRGSSLWSATSAPSLGRNGTAGGSIVLKGSSTGSGTITVAAAAGSVNFRLPITNGTLNQVLSTDGSGNTTWTTVTGTGTVTSVGLAMPGIFSVSGSPVIGAGTITALLNNQTANTVWSGPTTGAAASPTFRALVGADLPNPSASTLGGIQSFAAVSSQWIRQISTSGVPTASQPAFTDISGTLAAAQCPNPSASTLGCTQSLAAVASKWINTISTSGVPSATQPAFTDISGSAALAQLPLIGNNSVLGNNSGSTTIPSTLTASNVLDMVGSTRGQILYRGSLAWAALSPSTAGFVLSTNGAGADPSWISVPGTGTMQTITAGTGITLSSGATCTTTCTISLSSIADLRLMANVSGGSAAPVANTMTAILDATLGSTQGNILYRAAGNWTVLAPGTNGQVLTQGASTPAWGSAGSVTSLTISAGSGIAVSGTCTITTTGTCTVAANNSMGANKYQVFNTGSGTVTTPTGAAWAKFTITGAGGGGSGGGTASVGDGATGGSSCIKGSGAACTSPLYAAAGGGGGKWISAQTGGGGGSGSTGSSSCTDAYTGGEGTPLLVINSASLGSLNGMAGGNSFYGGAGALAYQTTGNPGANGGGGAGGGGASVTAGFFGGSGGGGGGTCVIFIQSPASSYTYAVGAAGTAGTAGTSGTAGGAGGVGKIVAEYGFN